MRRGRWKPATATVELCEPRQINPANRLPSLRRFEYDITVTYQAGDAVFLSDIVRFRAIDEGSQLLIRYDPDDPRRNTLTHPRTLPYTAFLVVLGCFAAALLLLLIVTMFGL